MSNLLRLLIVDDSEDNAVSVADKLNSQGFGVDFECVSTAEAMAAALEEQEWDVVIANKELRHFNWTDVVTMLRERCINLPFFVVQKLA